MLVYKDYQFTEFVSLTKLPSNYEEFVAQQKTLKDITKTLPIEGNLVISQNPEIMGSHRLIVSLSHKSVNLACDFYATLFDSLDGLLVYLVNGYDIEGGLPAFIRGYVIGKIITNNGEYNVPLVIIGDDSNDSDNFEPFNSTKYILLDCISALFYILDMIPEEEKLYDSFDIQYILNLCKESDYFQCELRGKI